MEVTPGQHVPACGSSSIRCHLGSLQLFLPPSPTPLCWSATQHLVGFAEKGLYPQMGRRSPERLPSQITWEICGEAGLQTGCLTGAILSHKPLDFSPAPR